MHVNMLLLVGFLNLSTYVFMLSLLINLSLVPVSGVLSKARIFAIKAVIISFWMCCVETE